jgi:hypothetical protein
MRLWTLVHEPPLVHPASDKEFLRHSGNLPAIVCVTIRPITEQICAR